MLPKLSKSNMSWHISSFSGTEAIATCCINKGCMQRSALGIGSLSESQLNSKCFILLLSLLEKADGSQDKKGSQTPNLPEGNLWVWWPKREVQVPPAEIRFMTEQNKHNSETQLGEVLHGHELTGRVDTWKAFPAFWHQIWITCAVHFRVHYSIWKAAVKEIGTRSTKNTMDIKNIEAVVTNKPQSDHHIYCLSKQSSFPPTLTQQ